MTALKSINSVFFAVCFIVTSIVAPAASAAQQQGADPAFEQFLDEVRVQARENGIRPEIIAALDGLQPHPDVQRLAAYQPEYVKPIWSYLDHLITERRLQLG